MALNLKDLRVEMPNYQHYKDWRRSGPILGIGVHHSATANRITGAPAGTAQVFFDYHVNQRGWAHGGYNYVISGNGLIEYALDDKISAYHAGFKDPDNSEGLENGQYWNNHYLAICLTGWFSANRTYRDSDSHLQKIPNNYTSPTEAQLKSLVGLIQYLRQKYNIPVENVRAHRELAGNSTSCPGHNLDPAQLRQQIRVADQPEPTPSPEPEAQPQVDSGQHVLLLPDTDRYLDSALTYIWKFQPDVSFSPNEAVGDWKYVTVVGDKEDISETQLARLRSGGAELVQRIAGDPSVAQATLEELVRTNLRFLTAPTPSPPPDNTTPEPEPAPVPEPEPPPPPEERTYTVQPGDTLSLIAKQMYGKGHLWRIIFEANRNILSDPGRIRPGQVLKIPPLPE